MKRRLAKKILKHFISNVVIINQINEKNCQRCSYSIDSSIRNLIKKRIKVYSNLQLHKAHRVMKQPFTLDELIEYKEKGKKTYWDIDNKIDVDTKE